MNCKILPVDRTRVRTTKTIPTKPTRSSSETTRRRRSVNSTQWLVMVPQLQGGPQEMPRGVGWQSKQPVKTTRVPGHCLELPNLMFIGQFVPDLSDWHERFWPIPPGPYGIVTFIVKAFFFISSFFPTIVGGDCWSVMHWSWNIFTFNYTPYCIVLFYIVYQYHCRCCVLLVIISIGTIVGNW